MKFYGRFSMLRWDMSATAKLLLVEIGTCDEPGFESWSPFCFKAHRALVLAGLRYQRAIKKMPAEGKAFNPTGQFPSLVVNEGNGGTNVPDSTHILHKLDELSGGKLTAGLAGKTLGEAWLWEELGDSAVNSFMLAARWADADNWPRARDAILGGFPKIVRLVGGPIFRRGIVKRLVERDVWRAGAEECWKRFETLLDSLEARSPESGYWMETPGPTVADLGLFAQLQSIRTRISPRQRALIEARQRLHAWLDRVDQATQGSAALIDPR